MSASAKAGTEVVMLHRVADYPLEPGPYERMTVPPANLEALLQTRGHRAAGSREDCLAARDGKARLLLTFDDGYAGFTEHVVPLLERYDVHAVVFVTTAFIDGTLEPVQALLARMLMGAGYPVIGDASVCGQRLADLYRSVSLGTVALRMRRLRSLATRIGAPLPEVRGDVYMGWDEVRQLDRHPLVTVGAHTKTHPRLPRVGPGQLGRELKGARSLLAARLGHPPELLAYPHGASNALVRFAARLAGYRYAFTTQPGVWMGNSVDRYRVPRFDIDDLLKAIRQRTAEPEQATG